MGRLIAIVEDEFTLRENYADAFRKHGYKVNTYANRRDADTAFKQSAPDLAIIDIGLGDESEGGFELCRELRSLYPVLPIIFLTARDSDLDTISGLRLGADDYLTKDISLAHLMARIAALLRRVDALSSPEDKSKLIKRGALTMDLDRMAILWDETPIPLTVTEFWIVHSLLRRPGHVKSRDQLMQDANVLVDDATITSHVKRIRRKFESVTGKFEGIETVYGMGYRWSSEQ